MILGIMHSKDVSMGTPLLARGRDRLETSVMAIAAYSIRSPLLARGRDRLETKIYLENANGMFNIGVPYSLGDAIDWKPELA